MVTVGIIQHLVGVIGTDLLPQADAGQVVNVIMSLLISSFALATLGPDLQCMFILISVRHF